MDLRTLRASAASAALILIAGCTSTPPAPIHRENLQEVQATVVDVKRSERVVTLRNAEGGTLTVELGPGVRNFDQIQTGDTVVASYYESIGFAVKDPNAPDSAGSAAVVAGRAAVGDRPAGAVGAFAETTIIFQSYDPDSHVVTYAGADGVVRAAYVKREDGRAFAKKLNAGDRVLVTREEAVAIRVDAKK